MPVDADGSYAEFSGGRDYQNMDETPCDDDTTHDTDTGGDSSTKHNSYLTANPAGYLNLPTAEIVSLYSMWWGKSLSATNSYSGWSGVRIASTDYLTSAEDISGKQSIPYSINSAYRADVNPNTSNPWTLSTVDNLELLVRRSRTFTTKTHWFSKVGVMFLQIHDLGANQVIPVMPT